MLPAQAFSREEACSQGYRGRREARSCAGGQVPAPADRLRDSLLCCKGTEATCGERRETDLRFLLDQLCSIAVCVLHYVSKLEHTHTYDIVIDKRKSTMVFNLQAEFRNIEAAIDYCAGLVCATCAAPRVPTQTWGPAFSALPTPVTAPAAPRSLAACGACMAGWHPDAALQVPVPAIGARRLLAMSQWRNSCTVKLLRKWHLGAQALQRHGGRSISRRDCSVGRCAESWQVSRISCRWSM